MRLLIKQKSVTIISLFIMGLILSYLSYYNEFWEGGADNVWHYYYSKYAWKYPDFFLHHWGKPLFIILSTGFSQFGFWGLQLFNIICGLYSAFIGYKILEYYNIYHKWMIVPLLLFSPLYFIILQSGLTEPLFSLLLITVSYLFTINKNWQATILASFILFSRSEGMFILICFAIYLIILKQYKHLPLLLFGFLLYAIFGVIMGHSFFWYFIENPYNYNSPYGHGHYMDILKRYDNIWGLPFLLLIIVSFFVLCFLFFKQKQYLFWKSINETSKVFYLLFIPSIAFLVFHLYVWHYGLCGSLGLERVLACVLPCFAVFTIWSVDKLLKIIPNKISFILLTFFLFFHIQTPFKTFAYPLTAYGGDKVELDAAKWFKTIMPEKCIIYYAHPNIIFNLNRDPFDKDLNREEFVFKTDCSEQEDIPTFFFWDSAFSESSCGVSLEEVEKCHYKKINEFTDGADFKLVVFEKTKL